MKTTGLNRLRQMVISGVLVFSALGLFLVARGSSAQHSTGVESDSESTAVVEEVIGPMEAADSTQAELEAPQMRDRVFWTWIKDRSGRWRTVVIRVGPLRVDSVEVSHGN